MWQATGETYRSATDFLVALNAAFAGKQRMKNVTKPPLPPWLLGPLWAPSFVRNRSRKNMKFTGNIE